MAAMSLRLACAFILFTTFTPALVSAHPLVERARRLYESADFSGALETIDAVDDHSNLTRQDLFELLELRALIGLAIEDPEIQRHSLEDLRALQPDHTFGPEVPPTITRSFAELEVPELLLGVRVTRDGGYVTIDARVRGGEVDRLVRQVIISGRTEDDLWQRSMGEPLDIEADGDSVEWYVQVIGLGGATLLERGTAGEPELEPAASREEEDRRRVRPWVWGVVAGAVVAVAALVLVSVIITNEDEEVQTIVTGPDVFGTE